MAADSPRSVYVFEADHGVKIGITESVFTRRRDMEKTIGTRVKVVRSFRVDNRSQAIDIEHAAFAVLADTRVAGEWFHCHPFEAVDVVHAEWRKRGYPRLTFDMLPGLWAANARLSGGGEGTGAA